MRDFDYKFFHRVNGDIVNYKSYEFSDSSFTTATITDMVEQYWPNISGNTYGLVRYSNNSSIWIGTYIKYGNDDGAITINGISTYSPFQRGVLIKTVWKWDSTVANSDLDGLGFPVAVQITDLHSINKSCIFYYSAGAANAPSSSSGGIGICMYGGTNWINLIVIPYSTTKIYVAEKRTTWSAWDGPK